MPPESIDTPVGKVLAAVFSIGSVICAISPPFSDKAVPGTAPSVGVIDSAVSADEVDRLVKTRLGVVGRVAVSSLSLLDFGLSCSMSTLDSDSASLLDSLNC